MARRRFQEPKLHWDARLERWECRYREDVEDTNTGKIARIRKKVYFPKSQYETQKLAKQALGELLKPINAITYKPKQTTSLLFAQFAKTWVKDTLVHYKPSVKNSSTYHVNNYLIPAFGDLSLLDVTATVVQAWVTKTTHEGHLGPKSISNIFSTFRMLWNSPGGALPLGLVTHNPTVGIKKPVVGESVVYSYSEEETRNIIFGFKDGCQDQLVARLMAESGMRPGEVPPLAISAIDFDGLKIHIEKAATLNQLHSPKGKGRGKKRTVVISSLLAADLKKHIGKRTEGFVFRNRIGGMMDITTFREHLTKVLRQLGIDDKAKKMGIDRLGLYPLRHGVNTNMVARGVDTKTRMLQVGHSQEETNRIYDHGNEASMRAYVEVRAEALVTTTPTSVQ